MKTTRRDFLKHSVSFAGGALVLGRAVWAHRPYGIAPESRVVSVAASEMLVETKYNPDAVNRAFEAGMKELTGQKTSADAWASLFGPNDVVGIKINCIGAPKISSSLASINATIAGLKSAGVKENNIIIWDRVDREFQRTGLAINKGASGVRVMGISPGGESILPWVEGFDRNIYVSYEDGTLKKFRELIQQGFTKEGTHRDIFNSVTWLWTLCSQGNEKAKKYESEIRRLYMDYEDREGIKRIAEEVADEFNDVSIEDEEKSFLANLVTKDITKLINIAVLKHNEDSGVTWATKNIALGVTTNKVRFHIDYCTRAIPDILAMPCLKNKMVLHIGEAAKISTVSVAGAQIALDNRIFFSRDPVAMDRIGLDILEEKRKEQRLESIRSISTHVAACAAKGLGTDDLSKIDLRAIKV